MSLQGILVPPRSLIHFDFHQVGRDARLHFLSDRGEDVTAEFSFGVRRYGLRRQDAALAAR
jgi:hypothetical protein